MKRSLNLLTFDAFKHKPYHQEMKGKERKGRTNEWPTKQEQIFQLVPFDYDYHRLITRYNYMPFHYLFTVRCEWESEKSNLVRIGYYFVNNIKI